MTDVTQISQSGYPFNTPLESGLRTLTLLAAMSPQSCDLQRLVYYDYLLVHTSDVDDAQDVPESLHPASPHRAGEVVVRRRLIQQGIALMRSKELLNEKYDEGGIHYGASEMTSAFLSYFETPYAIRLRTSAQWVVSHFANYSDARMSEYITSNLGRWGAEFVREALLHEEIEN